MATPNQQQDDEIVDPGHGQANGQPRPAAPAAPAQTGHSAFAVNAAQTYGLTDAQIAAIPPAELEAAVLRRIQADNAAAARAALAVGESRREAPVAPAVPAAPKEDEWEWGEEVDPTTGAKRKLTDDDFVPGLRDVKKVRKLEKELEALKEQIARGEAARVSQTIAERLDDVIAGFNRPDLFGEGGVDSLSPQSAEYQRRLAVVRATGLDFSRPPTKPALAAAMTNAFRALYPDAAKGAPAGGDASLGGYADALLARPGAAPAGGTGRPTPEEWAAGGLAPPTHRVNAPAQQKGRKAAEDAARQGLAKLGLKTDSPTTAQADAEALESLPD